MDIPDRSGIIEHMFDPEFGGDGDEHVASVVEPSAELLALWAVEDARYEDPKVVAGAVADFLAREAFCATEFFLGEPDGLSLIHI